MLLKSVLKFPFLCVSVGFLIKIFFLAYAREYIFEHFDNYILLIWVLRKVFMAILYLLYSRVHKIA